MDLVELNGTFVRQLQGRFETEPLFQAVADRARVLHCPVEELPHDRTYDVIVSGLPLNNFSAGVVEQILAALSVYGARRNTLVLRVHRRAPCPGIGERPERARTVARRGPSDAGGARPVRVPSRCRLAERPARLGSSRAGQPRET